MEREGDGVWISWRFGAVLLCVLLLLVGAALHWIDKRLDRQEDAAEARHRDTTAKQHEAIAKLKEDFRIILIRNDVERDVREHELKWLVEQKRLQAIPKRIGDQ